MRIAFKINNHITEYVAVETTIEYSTSIPFTTFLSTNLFFLLKRTLLSVES